MRSSGHIVVGVDDSDESRSALRWAGLLAGWTGTGLDVVNACPVPAVGYGWGGAPLDWDPATDRAERLRALVDEVLGERAPATVDLAVHQDSPARLLVELSRTAAVVVVGSRGLGGFSGLLLGSISAKVAEHGMCPVLVVHGDGTLPASSTTPQLVTSTEDQPMINPGQQKESDMTHETDGRRIVVGVDESEESKRALRWAGRMAAWTGAELDVVSAWQLPVGYGWGAVPLEWSPTEEREKRIGQLVDEVFDAHRPVTVNVIVREDSPSRLLIELSKNARMVVVGSRGLGGFSGLLLGSVSAKVAEHAKCPVLVVHGDQPVPAP
jgi:nucleotide-binding universal stress UspA family protein